MLQYIIHQDTIERSCDWLFLLLSLFSFTPQRAPLTKRVQLVTRESDGGGGRNKFNEFGHVICAYDYKICFVIQRSAAHFVGGFPDRFFKATFEAVTAVLMNNKVSWGVKLCPWLSSSRYSEGSLCHLNGPAVQYDCLVMNVTGDTILRNCGNSSSDTASLSRRREFDFSLFSKVHEGKYCYSQACLLDTDSYFVDHAYK